MGELCCHLTTNNKRSSAINLSKDLNVKETENFIETNYFSTKKKKKGTVRCFGISAQLIINSFRDTFKKAKEFDRSVQMTEQDDDEHTL